MEKKLSRLDILSLVLGSIIGWGSFTLPGVKFLHESGVINTSIGLFLGGVAVIFIQKGYHIMMQNHVEDGGEFSYTYKKMGRKHGFIVGWSLILCYLSIVPLNATAFVLVLKRLFGSKVEFFYLYEVAGYPVYLSEVLIASSVIFLFAAINIKGLQKSSKTQNFIVLFLVLNVLIIFTFMLFDTDKTLFVENYVMNYNLDFSQIAKVLAIVPFLFVGFDVIPQVSTELKFKPEKATRIAILGIFSGIMIYTILNLITGLVFSPGAALQQEWALGTAVMDHMGTIGFLLLVIALTAAVTSGINGFMISSSRLLAALSSYKLFNAKYAEINNNGVSKHSIIFVTLISLIAPWVGREVIIYIVDMSSLLAAIAYFYVCYIGVQNSENKLDKSLSFFGALVSLSFIALLVIPSSPGHLSTPSMIFMIIWGLLGMVYYRLYTNKKEIAVFNKVTPVK